MRTKVNKLNSMRAQLNLKQIKMLSELRLIFPVSEDLTPTKQKYVYKIILFQKNSQTKYIEIHTIWNHANKYLYGLKISLF